MVTSFDMMQPSVAADSVSAALSSGMHMQSRLNRMANRFPWLSIDLLTWLALLARLAGMLSLQALPLCVYQCTDMHAWSRRQGRQQCKL